MTFSISAIAACCARASFRSLLEPETRRRLTRLAGGASLRLDLAGLGAFTELALRVFTALLLPPVFDGRDMFAPKGQQGHLIGPNLHSGRGERGRIVFAG